MALRAVCSLTVAVLIVLAGCGPAADLPHFYNVDEFQLTDQTGAAFDSKSLAGSAWIADFIFTTCAGPCPRMSSRMRTLSEALGPKGVKFVSFTVDPERDTPAVLAEYAQRYHAEAGRWFFLTGPKPALHHITHDTFKLGEVTGALEHSTRFALVDKRGEIRGFYRSDEADDMKRLERDAKALAAD